MGVTPPPQIDAQGPTFSQKNGTTHAKFASWGVFRKTSFFRVFFDFFDFFEKIFQKTEKILFFEKKNSSCGIFFL
jgi:hypothetical protein